MALRQEELEKQSLSKGLDTISRKQISEIGPIGEKISNTLKADEDLLHGLAEKAPKNLSCAQTVDRYIDNFDDYGLYEEMKNNRGPYEYMNRKNQKTFTKAYFIEFLKKNFEFCDANKYTEMAKAMRYNYKDEQGARLESKFGNEYDNSEYVFPDTSGGNDYKGEPHAKWREYEYYGMEREYKKLGISKELDEKNIGTELFNRITGLLLSRDDEQTNFERIGAIMFLEKYIPHEFKNMKISRDKNFPGLSKEERHYIDDHIQHDIEYHFEDIINGIEQMNLDEKQREMIKNGMHKLYIARELMYSAYAGKDNVKVSNITRIINLPVFKKMRYGATASLLIISGLLLDQNKQDVNTDLFDVIGIEKYEKEIADKYNFWEEYRLGKSSNSYLVDYINYEALRAAIKDQKSVDIGAYH